MISKSPVSLKHNETQHALTKCHNQRQLRHVSLTIIIIVSNI